MASVRHSEAAAFLSKCTIWQALHPKYSNPYPLLFEYSFDSSLFLTTPSFYLSGELKRLNAHQRRNTCSQYSMNFIDSRTITTDPQFFPVYAQPYRSGILMIEVHSNLLARQRPLCQKAQHNKTAHKASPALWRSVLHRLQRAQYMAKK